jgi:hypothetical protein
MFGNTEISYIFVSTNIKTKQNENLQKRYLHKNGRSNQDF